MIVMKIHYGWYQCRVLVSFVASYAVRGISGWCDVREQHNLWCSMMEWLRIKVLKLFLFVLCLNYYKKKRKKIAVNSSKECKTVKSIFLSSY